MRKFILIPIVVLKTTSGFNAFSPIVYGCVSTDKTIDKTLRRMREALEIHNEVFPLLKLTRSQNAERVLKNSFKIYGDDAVYATLKIEA